MQKSSITKSKTSFMIDVKLNDRLQENARVLKKKPNELLILVMRKFFEQCENQSVITDCKVSYQVHSGHYERKSIYYSEQDYAFIIKARCQFRMSASLIIFVALTKYLDATFALLRRSLARLSSLRVLNLSPKGLSYSIWRWTGRTNPWEFGQTRIELKEFLQIRQI